MVGGQTIPLEIESTPLRLETRIRNIQINIFGIRSSRILYNL